MYERRIRQHLLVALEDTPVVLLTGARQTGISTLIKNLGREVTYYTFDDPVVLAAVQADPFGFVNALKGAVYLDEVQRAPGVFLAIKAAVDRDRSPGRFLLTGSANVLLLPQIADSLVGRMEVLNLLPLAQSEIGRQPLSLIERLVAGQLPERCPFDRADFIARLTRGGYPEVLGCPSERRRRAWFESYLHSLLLRDVRDLAQIDGLMEMPRLMRVLGVRSGSLLNAAELSRSMGIPQTTLKRYLTLLEALFLVRRVPAWSSSLGKRLQKSPKLFVSDYGLLAHLQGLSETSMTAGVGLPGDLVEDFVHAELVKHQGWSELRTQLMHYRTSTGVEVDFVLENRLGELIGIEVKATATISDKDFNGLRHLRDTAQQQFKRGVVFYTGEQVVPFDEQLLAVPLAWFWTA